MLHLDAFKHRVCLVTSSHKGMLLRIAHRWHWIYHEELVYIDMKGVWGQSSMKLQEFYLEERLPYCKL